MPSFFVQNYWNGLPAPAHESMHIGIGPESAGQTPNGPLLITLDAPYHDDPQPAGEPGIYPGLWDYEVCEVFLVAADGHYLELEFGPHSHYLALELEGPRKISSWNNRISYQTELRSGRWRGHAEIPAALLPGPIHRLNLFGIHGIGAKRRYLAWSPIPGDTPDFHQPSCFPRWPDPQGTAG